MAEQETLMKRVSETFNDFDETVLVVIKGHLLIEELLDEIIGTFVHHPDYIEDARLSFSHKIHIAKSMSLSEHNNGMWAIATKLNALRNNLAHSLNSPKRQDKTKAVIDAYLREANDDQKEMINGTDEHMILLFVTSYMIGFLNSFLQEVQRFREVVNSIDEVMNSNHRK